MARLKKQTAERIVVAVIATFTTMILSLGMLLSHGIPLDKISVYWIHDVCIGCLISIPLGYFMNPLIKKLVFKYVEQ